MIGILLINLGTPTQPTPKAVRHYLKEFLSDPRVIDLSPLARWLLVNCIIAPFRSARSAKNYQKIWTQRGSPLLFHTQDLGHGVQKILGEKYLVKIAMRYGQPSLQEGLEALRNCTEIRILPLYPQYASATTASTENAVLNLQKKLKGLPEIKFLPPFFDHPGFLKSFAEIGQAQLKDFNPDHILFSFHGLPERQILKEDSSGVHCLKTDNCCEKIVPANGMCYRAHCVHSARGIAQCLGLQQDQYSITFQSRLGRTPWLQPFTDLVLKELAQSGKKRVAVFCPSFVADCLETLEEIAITGRENFRQAGGEDLRLIPSLNSHPTWVQSVVDMLR